VALRFMLVTASDLVFDGNSVTIMRFDVRIVNGLGSIPERVKALGLPRPWSPGFADFV